MEVHVDVRSEDLGAELEAAVRGLMEDFKLVEKAGKPGEAGCGG